MTDLPQILLWTNNATPYEEAIAAAGLAARVRVEKVATNAAPDAGQRADTVALMAARAPRGLLATMPKLRWVQSVTAGVEDWLALPDLTPAITLTSARGTHAQSMPENILGALLYVAKPYAQAAQDQQRSTWVHRTAIPLTGQTLGILGMGVIGQAVAKLALALGMRVIGTRRRGTAGVEGATVLPPERTDEVLAAADYLLLLLPATPETESFINAARLARMKKTAWLLNFGRGALIDDEALMAATAAGTIAGAVLDVFREEPLPAAHRFWKAPGILVLPHVGGGYPARDRVVAALFADNLGRFLAGQKLRETVDRTLGY